MIVVGGTYSESVVFPHFSNTAGGSGMRAARAVGAVCEGLVTCLAEGESIDPALFRFAPRVERRAQVVGFQYLSPVSTPSIMGVAAGVDEALIADGETVLVFGMVEDVSISTKSKRLVIDPQSPSRTSLTSFDELTADDSVLSVNAREASNLLGRQEEPGAAASALLDHTGHSGVVVRAGARGSFVATGSSEVVAIPAQPSQTVWPIGSGDTYSAALAAAWSGGADLATAAQIASNATAWWCGQRDPVTPPEILNGPRTYDEMLGVVPSQLISPDYIPRVYLGGPFFTVAEHMLLDTVLHTLTSLGARPFSPFHHVGVGGDDVAQRDIDGLGDCDAMLALLDHYDPGTVYEAGWAAARGIPVVGYRSQRSDEGDKMLVGLGAEVHDDLTSALYRSVWAAQGASLIPGRHGSPVPA